MAPALIGRADASQEDPCGPFGKRPSDWVAISLGILLVAFAAVAWYCRVCYVSSRDAELRMLQARIAKLGQQSERRLAAENNCAWLRMELGEARARIDILNEEAAVLSEKTRYWGPQGLGISQDVTSPKCFTQISPDPNIDSFSNRVLGRGPSATSSVAMDALHRRGAEMQPALRVDTAVAPQKPVGSPIDTCGAQGSSDRGRPVRRTARDAFALATPSPYMSPMSCQPMGNLADELADVGADDDYFAVGSDDGYGDGELDGRAGRSSLELAFFATPSPIVPALPVSPVSPSTSVSTVSPPASPDPTGRWAKQGGQAESAAPPADPSSVYNGFGGAIIQEARRVTMTPGPGSVVASPGPSHTPKAVPFPGPGIETY